MNNNFGAWYRTANLEPEHELLQLRWKGISSYVEQDVASDEIINLVRMFYDLKTSPEFIDRFSNFFVESDSAFDTKNKLELSVLAGATLRELSEQDNCNNLIYFLVMSAAFCNKNTSVSEIQEEIMDLFNDACVNTREELLRYEGKKVTIPPLKTISKTFQAETVTWNVEVAKMLNTYFNGINKTLSELLNANSQHERYTSICAEDSQILWWLVGKWSNDFQKPFSNLKKQEAAIYAGKELADLVTILPGPYSARAVLSQVLSDLKKGKDDIIFSDSINSLSPKWKKSILGSYDPSSLEEINPILYAISLSLKVDNKEEWYPLFKKATSIDPCEIKCKTLEIAYQVYIECLTIKTLKKDA